ncbi:hypothetical protein AYL99_08575 [Fonsecaea erecta]|uniref:aldehyde dehydrogenase (NAD(+)) n=1 Tax=Fonsecaea erecta TaxID=1367422 RepID=A0A178ZDI0_9EURO|nr:hypothetical protein AYL99_08575 [Fonsecaea erecta]OAP57837.1 hypothetical protein AYL99_08575 [Fonsecaea erecta]
MAPSRVESISFTSFYNVVNGELRSSKTQYHAIDPTNKQPNWPVPVASPQDIEDAVAAANTAYAEWRTTSWEYRVECIARFKEAIEAYQEDLIGLLLKETGKPPIFAANEVKRMSNSFDWHMKLKEPQGEVLELGKRHVRHKYVPLGVAVAICPWNFPFMLSLAKILPAVQMGNAVIVKPSPFTPYTALKISEIANQVFPPGLVQALGGDDTLGPALVDHPNVHKISFTGSIPTGKRIMASAARTLKRVTLELGGNDPAIVLPDADVTKVAPLVAMGAFYNTGQVCVASKRIYVHSSLYNDFLDALIDATKRLEFGPIQNEFQYEKVKEFFQDAANKGYRFALGSGDVRKSSGFYIAPTIIDNPPDDSRVVQEEPFGPIIPVQSYNDVDEVIHRANDSKAGLGATVFGTDDKLLQEVADRLECGSVWINSSPGVTPEVQFGGMKESGIGTEFGTLGILAYANIKAISMTRV